MTHSACCVRRSRVQTNTYQLTSDIPHAWQAKATLASSGFKNLAGIKPSTSTTLPREPLDKGQAPRARRTRSMNARLFALSCIPDSSPTRLQSAPQYRKNTRRIIFDTAHQPARPSNTQDGRSTRVTHWRRPTRRPRR